MKKNAAAGFSGFFRITSLLTAMFFITVLFIRCAGKEDAAGEKLIGFSFNYDRSEVTLTVITKGCTSKADFSFKKQDKVITIIRLKKDDCKAMPEAVTFTYSLKEAGLNPDITYSVSNSFIANPNLAAIR